MSFGPISSARFCFVRHGETDWNVARRIQGQLDIPLNERGRAQARATARGLRRHRFDAIYSSDLGRALETAGYAAADLGLPVHHEPALRERHFGLFQRLTYAEAKVLHPQLYARHERREPGFVPPDGGESLEQLYRRVADGLRRLARRHPGQTLLLVTHGGVLDMVRRLATGQPLAAPRDFEIPNAALNWIETRGDTFHLQSWAERAHLEQALDELPG